MNAKAALGIALLRGEVITIKTAFRDFGITNAPREISRAIEKPFGLHVSRVRKEGESRYGCPCCWYEYRLNRIEANAEGIVKLKAYIQSQSSSTPPRTDKEAKEKKILDQINLF